MRPAVVSLVLALALASCGGDEFEDRTAVLTRGGETVDLIVDACGLEETTVRILARSERGTVVQAVVGVEEADHETGLPESSGITVMDGDDTFGAFGDEAWERRGKTGPAPGEVSSSGVRGARIALRGELVPLDDRDEPLPDGEPVGFVLDTRCDQR